MKNILKSLISKIIISQSKLILAKYKPKIISVTGSVGKTSTKDAIFTAISSKFHSRKSQKSFNSDIGVPLTILGCQNGWNDPIHWLKNIFHGFELIFFKCDYPKVLVLEIGADHPGDIKMLSKWIQSDIVVLTKIGEVPAHVEFFPTIDDVIREKCYLIDTLKPDGNLIIFSENNKVLNTRKDIKNKIYTFGDQDSSYARVSEKSVIYDEAGMPSGMDYKIYIAGEIHNIKVGKVIGGTQIFPLLAAATVGILMSLTLDEILRNLHEHEYPKGRMKIIEGINGTKIIDDTYNSSPDALKEGLHTLSSLNVSGKRIAVLGDMLELGSYSGDEHKKAGILAVQASDILIVIGPRARAMSERAISFNDAYEAGDYLKNIISAGDVIFVKGSQSMRMERVVKAIMKNPGLASELLVRQESEWLAKK